MNVGFAPFLLAAWIEFARLVTVARESRVRLIVSEPPTDFLERGESAGYPSPARPSIGDATSRLCKPSQRDFQ
jgi:hypothetical protein